MTSLTSAEIAANVHAVRARIVSAATRVDRDPAGVVLVAAAKQKDAVAVEAAIAAGITDIGENYVQEGLAKRSIVRTPARWHMIGHLQRNKVSKVLGTFDLIHTIDSVELGAVIASRAQEQQRIVQGLVEVNLGAEPNKSGVAPGAVRGLIDRFRELNGLRIEGLMAVPPAGPVEVTRSYFQQLRALRDDMGLRELSMGMTDDFEIAIEEGATIVRVGRAIFGARS